MYENVDQDEGNWVFDTINDYQIKLLTACDRIHGGEWKTARKGPVKIGPKPVSVTGPRLRRSQQALHHFMRRNWVKPPREVRPNEGFGPQHEIVRMRHKHR